MDITFTISSATATRLRQIALKAGYPNAAKTAGSIKNMTRAYWEAAIRADKQGDIEAAKPQVDMSDVDLGASE